MDRSRCDAGVVSEENEGEEGVAFRGCFFRSISRRERERDFSNGPSAASRRFFFSFFNAFALISFSFLSFPSLLLPTPNPHFQAEDEAKLVAARQAYLAETGARRAARAARRAQRRVNSNSIPRALLRRRRHRRRHRRARSPSPPPPPSKKKTSSSSSSLSALSPTAARRAASSPATAAPPVVEPSSPSASSSHPSAAVVAKRLSAKAASIKASQAAKEAALLEKKSREAGSSSSSDAEPSSPSSSSRARRAGVATPAPAAPIPASPSPLSAAFAHHKQKSAAAALTSSPPPPSPASASASSISLSASRRGAATGSALSNGAGGSARTAHAARASRGSRASRGGGARGGGGGGAGGATTAARGFPPRGPAFVAAGLVTSATAASGVSLSPAASASLLLAKSRLEKEGKNTYDSSSSSSPPPSSSTLTSENDTSSSKGESGSGNGKSDPALNPNFAADSGWAKLTPLARAIARNPLLDADEEKSLAVEVQEVLRLEGIRAELLASLSSSSSSAEGSSPSALVGGKKKGKGALLKAAGEEETEEGEGAEEGAGTETENDEEEEAMPRSDFSAEAAAALALASVSSSSSSAPKPRTRARSSSSLSGSVGFSTSVSNNSSNGGNGVNNNNLNLSLDPKVWAAAAGLESVEELKLRLYRGAAARERMVGSNTRLVISIARRYIGKGLELEDLVLEGLTGLMRGIEKFDPTRGFKFSTYAHWWIRQAVTRAVSEQGRIVRLPVHLHEMMARVKKAEDDLSVALGRAATEAEVAAASGFTAEKIASLRRVYSTTRSIDDPGRRRRRRRRRRWGCWRGRRFLGRRDERGPHWRRRRRRRSSASGSNNDSYGGIGGAGEAGDAADLSPSRPGAFARAIASSLTKDVESVLAETLGARESGVLRMRYGLDDGRPKTLEEIGAAYSVTRERIRQIEAKALLKLRAQPDRCSTLADYAEDAEAGDAAGLGWKGASTKARN